MANQGEIFFYYLPPPDSRIGNPLSERDSVTRWYHYQIILNICSKENAFVLRIFTEEKAKVVATAWLTELIQFLAVLAILH